MTSPHTPPPAGCYPSPDGAPVLRWWDGTQWTAQQQPQPTPLPAGPTVRGDGLTGLATATRVLLISSGIVRQASPAAFAGLARRIVDHPVRRPLVPLSERIGPLPDHPRGSPTVAARLVGAVDRRKPAHQRVDAALPAIRHHGGTPPRGPAERRQPGPAHRRGAPGLPGRPRAHPQLRPAPG
ncbi:MAG: DUF2510 domain-containing protein [Propionibacteriaceae bacterium]|nr:DUF2510 domain-containing protein [Propionibacteriaceae bacterium]